MSYEMMSAAQFWWNHLSFDQQCFINNYASKQEADKKMTQEEIVMVAHQNKHTWHQMPNWPEWKPQR